MGLIAIFSTAAIPIAIMGSALEASKLVAASWLYRNWKVAPLLLKTYFTTAVVVLMILTSMGIFGYLSKAHLDQAVPTGDVVSKLQIYDDKIKTSKENVDANRKALKQLDEAVDQVMARSTDEKGAEKAVAIRRGQTKERARLFQEIEAEQKTIAKLNEERAPIAAEVRKVEAEVGPIKYIAALIYGDVLDDSLLESSVRIVIMMIVFVFDPLAVLLLIAANRETLTNKSKEETEDVKSVEDWFDKVRERARSLDDEVDAQKSDDRWNKIIASIPETEKENKSSPDPEEVLIAKATKEDWQISPPPAEFTKVVNDYFKGKDKVNEEMLYVNEDPETFILNPDFNPKDPFEEKKQGSVRPNSRRTGASE
jgi:hypothetical protein